MIETGNTRYRRLLEEMRKMVDHQSIHPSVVDSDWYRKKIGQVQDLFREREEAHNHLSSIMKKLDEEYKVIIRQIVHDNRRLRK